MIALWMLYSLGVSATLSAGALALEHVLRLRGAPLRWAWAGALLGSLSLAAIPWVRSSEPTLSVPTAPSLASTSRASTVGPPGASVQQWVRVVPFRDVPSLGKSPAWARANRPLVVLWTVLSGASVLYLAGSHRRLQRGRRTWRRTKVDGVPILVSRDTGPAVVGFFDGAIVVPEWVLGMGEVQRHLILAHEEEHLHAGDLRLLTLALVALALMPWNAPLWWQVRRLRHSVELDCDARVLARGPNARTYGALLIEIGQKVSEHAVPIAAFSESSSLLERRIKAMFNRNARGGRSLGGVCAGLAVLLVAVACEIPLPTMAEAAPTSVPVTQGDLTGSLMSDGPRSIAAPGTPDTLVFPLKDGGVLKLRVRTQAEKDVPGAGPAICSDPLGDDEVGEVIWPNCGGYRLYADWSVRLPTVHPVMGQMAVDGPAWRAGLRSGDVLLSVDGHDTRTILRPFGGKWIPGGQYSVRVRRGTEEHEFVFPVGRS